jgi:hypothetical protein
MAIEFLNGINVSGDVGIGTTNPGAKLQVDSGTTNVTSIFKSSDNQAWISVKDSGSATFGALFGVDTDAGHEVVLANNSATKRLVIDTSGKVGIGTTSPSAKLDVVGNVNTDNSISIQGVDTGNPAASTEELRLSGYGVLGNRSAFYLTNGHSTGSIIFGVGGTGGNHNSNAKMVLNASGNLGIGTTNPGSLLHVEGSRTTAALQVNQTGTGVIANFKQGGNSKVLIDNSGKVGIGTDSPSEELHVNAGDAKIENGFASLFLDSTSIYGAANSIVSQRMGGTSPVQGSLSWLTGQYGGGSKWSTRMTSSPYTTSFINLPHDSSGGNFAINIENNERLTIDRSNGNVGIGTTSPLEKLHVEGNLELQSNFQISSNSGSYWQRIRTVDASASTTNAFIFETRNGSGNYLSHMVIRNDGNVGIGTATPATELEVNGAIRAGSGPTRGFEINTGYGIAGIKSYYGTLSSTAPFYVGGVNGVPYKSISASAFYVNSDYRLKSNVTALENAIERVKKLNVCRFNWKDKLDEEKVDGFIAHEVAEVIPEAVTGDKDAIREDGTLDTQQIDQSKVVPLLTAALKEAIEKIEQLETRIQTLEKN